MPYPRKSDFIDEVDPKRREFLQLVLLGLATGKIGYDAIKDIKNGYIENKIYNELPKYVHLFENRAIADVNGKKINGKVVGCGIAVEDKFITLSHIRVPPYQVMNTPFGPMQTPMNIKESKFYIGDKELEEILNDPLGDRAVFKNPGLEPFPCKPRYDYKIGEPVYIVGNPALQGSNVRKANISDVDGVGIDRLTYGCFGIDKAIIGGDSGTPLVGADFRLLGLSAGVYWNQLGYVKKMSMFRKYIDKDYGKSETQKIMEMPI